MAKSMNVVLLTAALLSLLVALTAARSLNEGTHRPGAILVRSERVFAGPVRNQYVQRTVQWSGTRNVTLVQAFDQFNNGTGGIPSIASGGINQRFVTVALRSSGANRGISFQVNIYAL